MSIKKMSVKETEDYFLKDAQKMEIRSMCESDPVLKALYEKRSRRLKNIVTTMRKLWGGNYYTATMKFDDDMN